MVTEVLHCPHCHGIDIVRPGTIRQGKQRYRCRACAERGRTFLLEYIYAGHSPAVNLGVYLRWALTCCEATDRRYGPECQRYSRYRTGVTYEPYLGGDRMPSLCSCKPCWSRVGSRGFTRMDGERTSGTLPQSNAPWASSTHKRSRASISIYGLGSRSLSAALYVCPQRRPSTHGACPPGEATIPLVKWGFIAYSMPICCSPYSTWTAYPISRTNVMIASFRAL